MSNFKWESSLVTFIELLILICFSDSDKTSWCQRTNYRVGDWWSTLKKQPLRTARSKISVLEWLGLKFSKLKKIVQYLTSKLCPFQSNHLIALGSVPLSAREQSWDTPKQVSVSRHFFFNTFRSVWFNSKNANFICVGNFFTIEFYKVFIFRTIPIKRIQRAKKIKIMSGACSIDWINFGLDLS